MKLLIRKLKFLRKIFLVFGEIKFLLALSLLSVFRRQGVFSKKKGWWGGVLMTESIYAVLITENDFNNP